MEQDIDKGGKITSVFLGQPMGTGPVAKEPISTKGPRITSEIFALPLCRAGAVFRRRLHFPKDQKFGGASAPGSAWP